jgi:acyl-CoA thioester hydrolase
MRKPYFPFRQEDPLPLRHTVERRVRFEEVDALGIVWHGRYPSYFEDARAALGEKYGVGYMDFHKQGVVAPITRLYVDYHRPLRFQETFTTEGILHWSDAARINTEFILRDSQGQVTTTGYTVQVMLDFNEELLMVPPAFYVEFRERWKAGALS